MSDAGIREIFDRYVQAVKASDVDGLLALYADDVHVFDLMAPFERHGRESSRQLMEAWLGDPGAQQHAAIEDLVIVQDGDLAFVRAAVNYSDTMADGTSHSMWNRATWALRRIDGEWKIIAEHTSVPLSDPEMQPVFERVV